MNLHYEITGDAPTALLFVHGWLGNSTWWDGQRDYFSDDYTVVQMDLSGHGKSPKPKEYSLKVFADDIKAVADKIKAEKIVLIGHSMSGASVVEAASKVSKLAAVILIDTLHNLDKAPNAAAVKPLFDAMKQDYAKAIDEQCVKYLFAKNSPKHAIQQITTEFKEVTAEHAIATLEWLYKTDMREAAKKVKVPVRSINSELEPTDAEANAKYFKDYDFRTISGVGHYPMLETPTQFNRELDDTLEELELNLDPDEDDGDFDDDDHGDVDEDDDDK